MESINLKALREDYKFCILQNGFSLKIGSSYITPCNIANTMNNTINKFQICPLTHDRKLKGGLGRANDYAIHRITSSVEIWKFHLQTNCEHPVTHFLLRAFSSSTHFFRLILLYKLVGHLKCYPFPAMGTEYNISPKNHTRSSLTKTK